MKEFQQLLRSKLESVNELIDKTPKSHFPKGYKYTRRCQKGNIYYLIYYKDEDKKATKYLGSPYSIEAKNLLKDCLIEKIHDTLISNKNVLEKNLSKYYPLTEESIMSLIPDRLRDIPQLNPKEDEFIRAVLATENNNAFQSQLFSDEYKALIDWANDDYEKNPKPFGDSVIIACDGTRVRSKGECIWYNSLYKEFIPSRYDPVLRLKDENGNTVVKCPDFLIKCLDGTLIIIEHLGMLSNPTYFKDFIEKVQLYQRNGFTLGVNFFVTSDEIHGGTNSLAIENNVKMIKEIVLSKPNTNM